jgi:hypothetical protein
MFMSQDHVPKFTEQVALERFCEESGQHLFGRTRSMVSRSIWSLMKKQYRMSMCREYGPQDFRPFLSNRMVF